MDNEIQISYNFYEINFSFNVPFNFFQPLKNIGNIFGILSLQAMQKQAADQIWPMGCSFPNSWSRS